MKRRVRLQTVVWILIVSLAVTACGAPAVVSSPETAAAANADSVAATVVAQLEGRQPEPAPSVDVEALQARILAAVDERLEQVDAQAIAQIVEEAVAAQLTQQSQVVPIAQRDAIATAVEDAGVESALVDLYRQVSPAVVYIVVPPLGSGSGFVYGQDGFIVTNNHVVDSGRTFEVVFATGERKPAELVGTDVDSDLAVLKVDSLPAGIDPLPLAAPGSLQVGQFVVAIGNPFGEQGSMSLGIVSALGRSLRSQRGRQAGTAYSLPGVIQTDAPINPGNSGGPLLNLDGEVVGVNSAIATTTGVNSGVGFSIPAAAVRQIVPFLIEQGRYVYGYMGAGFDDEISLSDQEQLNLPQARGAYVISVTPGGPADRAGLVPANPNTGRDGDLIVEIDGMPIRDFSDLNSYLVFNTTVDQTIEMTVLREGERVVVPLTLGARP